MIPSYRAGCVSCPLLYIRAFSFPLPPSRCSPQMSATCTSVGTFTNTVNGIPSTIGTCTGQSFSTYWGATSPLAGYTYISSAGYAALWVAFACMLFSGIVFLFLSYVRNIKAEGRCVMLRARCDVKKH